MFPIFQYVYVGTLLLFPLFVVGYFAVMPGGSRYISWAAAWPKNAVIYFVLAILATGGLSYLWARQGLEFYFEMGPMAREFEVSIVLSKDRMIWVAIFTAIALFQSLAFLDDFFIPTNAGEPLRRPLLFSFFSLFAILTLVSGRALLAVLFLEGSVFLLHLLKMDYDEAEKNLDYVSFFKRSVFVILGLGAMVVLSIAKAFPDDAIFVAGFVLYLMSLVFHNHSFTSWNRASWFVYPLFFALFIFWRIYQAEASAPDFTLIAFIFTILSSFFAILGFISPHRLICFYWYCISLVSLQFFTLFNSSAFERSGWAESSTILAGGLLLFIGILRGIGFVTSRSGRILGLLALGLLHLIMVGLLPGVGWMQLQRLEGDGVLYLVAQLVSLFLLSANLGRLLEPNIHEDKTSLGIPLPIFMYRAILALVVVLFVFQQAVGLELSGISLLDWDQLIQFALTKRALLGTASLCVAFGMLIGAISPTNSFFAGFLRKRERRMAETSPRVDPRVYASNVFVAEAPQKFLERVRNWSQTAGDMSSVGLQELNTAYETRVWREFAGLGRSFSLLVRYLHGGSVQLYMFYGFVALCASAILLYVVS